MSQKQIVDEPISGIFNFLSFAFFLAMEQVLAESARSGKPVSEVLASALEKTNLNSQMAETLLDALREIKND